MATIGAETVEILRGNINPQSQRVEVWSIAGRTGIGAQLMGENQSSFRYLAILFDLDVALESRLVALAALQGTVVTITDDFGKARANCLVVLVGVPRRKLVIRDGIEEVRAELEIKGVLTA